MLALNEFPNSAPCVTTTTGMSIHRRRLDFVVGHRKVIVIVVRPNLDSAVLKTIHIVVCETRQSIEGLECAPCLCEAFCKHGFRVEL